MEEDAIEEGEHKNMRLDPQELYILEIPRKLPEQYVQFRRFLVVRNSSQEFLDTGVEERSQVEYLKEGLVRNWCMGRVLKVGVYEVR